MHYSLKVFSEGCAAIKGYFLINIIGLSIAMSASMLILVWILYEKSFDRTNPGASNIYRVYSHINMNGNNFTSSMSPPPLADALKQFPEVIESTRVWSYNNLTVNNDEAGRTDKAFNEKQVYLAGLFAVISFLGSAYPSLYLSSFSVIKAIKGEVTDSKNTIGLKRVLVIAQFAISIGLVLSTALVCKQLHYLREKSPGFNKENILIITDPSMKLGEKADAFIKQLRQNSAIKVQVFVLISPALLRKISENCPDKKPCHWGTWCPQPDGLPFE